MSVSLSPYAEYKDSGLPWLGRIPAHWELKRGKFLFREVDDRTNTGQETLLSMRQHRGLVPHNEVSDKEIGETELIGYKRTQPGDVVMNRMRASSGMFACTLVPGLVSPDYAVLKPDTNVNPEYFVHLFKCPAMSAKFRAESKGLGTGTAGFLRLYSDRFGAVSLPAPPREEQQEMISYLRTQDQLFARLIRIKQRLIELLNEQRQAIIHNAVTRGLDPDAPIKPTGLDWLPEVPERWKVKRLKYLVKNINDQTASRSDDEVYVALEHIESWSGEVNLPDEVPDFDSQVKRFQAGDVLFGKLRPYLAKVTRPQYKGVCVGELLVLRDRDRSLLPEYVEQKLRSRQIIDLINSSTFGAKMPRADWAFISNISLAYPPSFEEQRAILNHIAEESKTIDAAIRRARSEIDLIGEYRTRLVSDVVTGKLDVRGVELPEVEEIEDAPGVEETLLSGFADFAEESHIAP